MIAITLRTLGFLWLGGLGLAAVPWDQEIILAPQAGAEPADLEIARWQERVRSAGATTEVFERLAWAYIAKARLTLDGGFYKLAEKTADVIEAKFGVGAESRLLRGHVLHQMHRFQPAERIAREAVAARGSPADWALMSDVLIEQGKLTEGVAALQRLVNLKPGVESYSRISYVRWLKGDLEGAQVAMQSAIRASDQAEAENGAWLLTRFSGLHLQSGAADVARQWAEAALQRVSSYPPALLAQGRTLLALEQLEEAIEVLRRAEQVQPLPEYQWWLADALRISGRSEEATAVERRLRLRGAETDPRTLALFLATRGEEPVRAVRLARAELANRGDVFSHDALAWTLLAAGERAAAASSLQAALAEGTKDARLLLHAGELARAEGRSDAAQAWFAKASQLAGSLTPSERAWLARRMSPAAAVTVAKISPEK